MENLNKNILKNYVNKKEYSAYIPKYAVIAVLAFTAILYIKTLFNGFNSWDDNFYILENNFIKDFSLNGVKNILVSFCMGNYHPLTLLTYLLEYKLFGLNPLPYHLLNVLIHLLNILLVYNLTKILSGKNITSIIVSLLFAIHPMHVESVAWLSERKDVLYTLFYLLSLLIYLRYIKTDFRKKYYYTAILFFILSLLSKSAAVTLPVLMLAVDFYEGRKFNAKLLSEKIPFFLLSLLFGILAIISQQSEGAFKAINEYIPISYSLSDKIFLLTHSISFYIIKLIFPINLSAMYYFPEKHGGYLPWEYYSSLIFILVIAWLVIKRSTFRKELIFGFLFFLITISVMLQVVPVGNAITAERYTYIPYLGLFYIAAQWFSDIKKKTYLYIFTALFALFIIFFSCQTWKRTDVWKNGKSLFTDVIKKNPVIYHGYWARGKIKNKEGDIRGALYDFDMTLKYRSDYIPCLMARGFLRNEINDYQGALKDMSRVISLNTGIADAYNTRGILRARTGDTSGAFKDFKMALKIAPNDAGTYCNLGNLKAMKNDFYGAVKEFTRSLKINPHDSMTYYNRGISLLNLKDTTAACKDWERAFELGYKETSQAIYLYCR